MHRQPVELDWILSQLQHSRISSEVNLQIENIERHKNQRKLEKAYFVLYFFSIASRTNLNISRFHLKGIWLFFKT